jgi:hypothetical protein
LKAAFVGDYSALRGELSFGFGDFYYYLIFIYAY